MSNLKREVLRLESKGNLSFNVNTIIRLPRLDSEGNEVAGFSWILTGGRLGQLAAWALKYTDDEAPSEATMHLQCKQFIDPPIDAQTEVIQKFIVLDHEWNCWGGSPQHPYREILVLSLGRRKDNQGASLYSILLNQVSGQVRSCYKHFNRWPGVRTSTSLDSIIKRYSLMR